MNEQTTPTPATEIVSPKDAKARAKADKAYAKASRPWFKKKRFIIPLLLVLIIAIFQMTNSGSDTASTTPSGDAPAAVAPAKPEAEAPAKPDAEAVAKVGTKVRDGKFEFVVTKVEKVGKSIPTAFGTTEKAQGEFILVTVNATNIENEPQMLDSTSQQLFNDKDQKFSPSSAVLSLKDADKFFLTNINPGNTVTGAPLLFDVPAGTKIASIELHDSPFSDGVKVALS